MPKKLTKEEAKELRETRRKGGLKKETLFIKDINELRKGEELLIEDKEWKMKTTMTAYYYNKFTKNIPKNEREISYEKVKGGLLITKIK